MTADSKVKLEIKAKHEKAGELAAPLEKVLQSDERRRMSEHDKWDLVVQ